MNITMNPGAELNKIYLITNTLTFPLQKIYLQINEENQFKEFLMNTAWIWRQKNFRQMQIPNGTRLQTVKLEPNPLKLGTMEAVQVMTLRWPAGFLKET